ncbi:MAG: hypothetical protein LBJ17_00225 [Dysgonamonadaceae bacterium]|jgi:uncharacterized protein (DUF608 family)|nr:hypothetical protein [Dysgonamonadaceae bacterium]
MLDKKSISRRNFIRKSGITLAAGLFAGRMSAIGCAKHFSSSGWATEGIPVDKNLDPEWIKSLYERGMPTVYSKSRNELKYIGMPVGGINAGGVYLGGDGRLWLWDIFNDNREGIEPKLVKWQQKTAHSSYVRSCDGACYVEPAQNIRPLDQGFAFRFEYGGKTVFKTMKEHDWDEILFEAGYPVGTVRYIDQSLPVEIILRAYSPFIPLNEEDSGLPATILSFAFKNTGTETVKTGVAGWLENKTGINSVYGEISCRRCNRTSLDSSFAAVDQHLILLSDRAKELKNKPDFGTMCIASLNADSKAYPSVDAGNIPELFSSAEAAESEKPVQEPLTGAVHAKFDLSAGAEASADFVISWYFPNLRIHNNIKDEGQYYQNSFSSALEVARYIHGNFDRLSSQTLLWAATWKDSTLPHWFLERTLMTIDTLATSNCHRFKSGRFWAWEGVGACHGTCTHVWHYAQAMGRIFPALERDCRERTDLGISLLEDGGIKFRAEMDQRPAIDGQAGTVLRCYREHLMSADDSFLRRNWDKIRKAIQFIIDQDRNGDGMVDTPLENTLDAVWDGEIAWIVGLCIAAVKAGHRMAEERGDKNFALKCADYVSKGSSNMDKHLFNGEYYIHRPDKSKGRSKLGSYNTCHIDQVMGQSWAYQVGLGQILDNQKVRSALKSLWQYNFAPDVGPYIKNHQGGRPYALSGESGLIMNTNPCNDPKPYGEDVTWQIGYFHECMTGFEYQVASHMIAEGMTDEGLAIVRSIHDRYHAVRRNPYNEIECSDHYARAMASYGAFITACGFEYHGPEGYMRFSPRWGKGDFKAPFTAAEGWGSYSQKQSFNSMECILEPVYGQVQLSTFSADAPKGRKIKAVSVLLGGHSVSAEIKQTGGSVLVSLQSRITIKKGEKLILKFS